MSAIPNPYDVAAERAILGGVLIEPSLLDVVVEAPLGVEDFYATANGLIFQAMLQLRAADKPIDTLTLRDQLASADKLEFCGGDAYLFSLTNTIPTIANIEAHAKIVREKSVLRRVLAACKLVQAEAGEFSNVDTFLDQAQHSLNRAFEGRATVDSTQTIGDVVGQVWHELTQVPEDGHVEIPCTTGLATVDRVLYGYERTKFYVIAARPGMGKSAFALRNCLAIAQRGDPCAFIGLEMENREQVKRALAGFARLNNELFRDYHSFARNRRISRDEYDRATQAAHALSKLPLYLDFCTGVPWEEIRRKIRRLHQRHGIKAVFIDYLQLMRCSAKHESREQEVATISRDMKVLAGQLGIAVVACAQVNREADKRASKRPQLSDIRESGAIEQDANAVILLHRELYPKPGEPRNIAEVIIEKNRSGRTGVVKALFNPEFTWFDDLAQEEAAE